MMVFYDDHFGQGYSAKLVFRHLCFSKLVGWQSVLLQTQLKKTTSSPIHVVCGSRVNPLTT